MFFYLPFGILYTVSPSLIACRTDASDGNLMRPRRFSLPLRICFDHFVDFVLSSSAIFVHLCGHCIAITNLHRHKCENKLLGTLKDGISLI